MPTQRELARDMRAARREAEREEAHIRALKESLDQARRTMSGAVSRYTEMRRRLFERKLAQHKMDWCTKCEKVVPTEDTALLCTTGTEKYSRGYGNAYYGYQRFFNLYRACTTCRQAALDRHGSMGHYDSYARGQSAFYAFEVMVYPDGYHARQFGRWKQVAAPDFAFPPVPEKLVEQFTEEWGLPPRIKLNSNWPRHDDQLVTREQEPQKIEATATA